MGNTKETMKLNDACNGCDAVDRPLSDDGYCAPCMKEERSGPRLSCDIDVRDAKAEKGFRKCKQRGRFYNPDDSLTRCAAHEAQYNRMVAGYMKDMKEAGYIKPSA